MGGVKNTFNKASGSDQAPELTAEQQLAVKFFTAVYQNDAMAVLSVVISHPEVTAWKNKDGMTALMCAARDGFRETAWLLIKAGADLEIGNDNDSTAMMFAAHAGKATIVVMLADAGANINHTNHNGHTPLMSASANGFKNTAEQLLKRNADTTPKDNDGSDALAYAKENGFTEIATMIEMADKMQRAAAAVRAVEAAKAARNPKKPDPAPVPVAAAPPPEPEPEPAPLAPPPAPVQDDNKAHITTMADRMKKAGLDGLGFSTKPSAEQAAEDAQVRDAAEKEAAARAKLKQWSDQTPK